MFDIVGGTSIGGIIALGSTWTKDSINPLVDHNQIVEIFSENGKKIFDTSKFAKIIFSLFTNKYYDQGIEEVLSGYFSNTKLSDVVKGTDAIITTVHRVRVEEKYSTKIFKSKNAKFNERKDFYMRDVGRATSAAPTYFSSAEIKNILGTK